MGVVGEKERDITRLPWSWWDSTANTWPAPPGALRTLLEMGWNPVEWPDVDMALPQACR